MDQSNRPLEDDAVDTLPLGDTRISPEEKNSVRRENGAIEVSVATNRKAEDVATEIDQGARQSIEDAKSSVPDPIATQLTASTESMEDAETASTKLQEAAQKKQEFSNGNGFFLEGALTSNDPNYSPALARLLTNQQIAAEILEERFKEANEKGLLGKSVDFIDRFIFRHIPIGMYEDITRETENKGLELAQAASQMSPDEYREYIEAYANDKAAEGFFTDENYFAFMDAVDESQNAGYDAMANINQVIGIAEAIPLLKPVLSAGKMVTRVAGIRGPKAGAEAYKQVDEAIPGTQPDIQAEGMARQFDPTSDPSTVKPTLGFVAAMAENNKLIGDIQYLYKSGTFGRVATQEQIKVASERVRDNIEGISSRTIADENISLVDPIGLGDYTSVFNLGKAKDGDPYISKANAEKYSKQLQERGLAARVTEVSEGNPNMGYYVEVSERLDLTKAGAALDLNEHQMIFNRTLGRVLGSTMQRDDDYLNTLANMGESGMGAIRESVMPYLKPLEQLNLDSKAAIGQVFKELRDGPDAHIRRNYTEQEFAQKFRQYHPQNKKPTEADYDAFLAAKTVSDAAYIMQANKIALRYVEKGYKSIKINDQLYVPGRIAKDVTDDTPILSAETGRIISRRDLSTDSVVWRLDREIEDGLEYVASPKNVTTVRYEDVLGYNSGGRRTNPDAKYFVTSGDRAILTSFTEKQARLAADQIGAIFRVVRERGAKLGDLTDELDEIIKKNNDWNPSIENTADFVKLATKKGWRADQNVSLKARDSVIEGAENDLFAGLTMDDYVKATQRRSDDVLMEFGGNETFNYNPIKSMVDQLSDVSSEFSFRSYTQNSKTSWLKSAGFGKQLKEGANVNALWNTVDPTEIPGARGRRLRELKAIIDRRDQVKSSAHQFMSDFGESVAEWVFEKSGGKLKVNLGEMDVAGSLLNLGFRSAFGFLNISQFFLQSSHALVIASISPKHGSKAAGMIIPLRIAMASKDPKGLKNLAKFMNMTDDDMDQLVKYINTSGRKSIKNDDIQKGTGPGWGISSWEGQNLRPSAVRKGLYQASKVVNKIDEVGLAAFNEGERLSRWTGMITAFLEYKAKFKGADALSDSGRAWITRREQNLSFNMTTTSRGAWQSGLMKVPTQWLSYSMRAVENTLLGRGFTKGERARMALMMASMGGGAGVFAGSWVDQIGEKYDMDPNDPKFVGLQYGWIDGIMSWGLSEMSGEELRTAFGTRIAPLTAFTDLYRKVTEESTLTALGGPSGEIVGGAFGALWKSFGNIVSGNSESSWDDIQEVLRTPSGVDNFWKAAVIANEGVYRSKSGTEIPLEFSDWEAAMQAVGVTNYRVADFYSERTKAFRDSRDMRKFRRTIQNDMRSALRLAETDEVRGYAYMDEIAARINASDFSEYDKMSLRRSVFSEFSNPVADLAMRKLQQGDSFGNRRVESWVKRDENEENR